MESAPRETRTPNRLFRRQVLCPIELWAQLQSACNYSPCHGKREIVVLKKKNSWRNIRSLLLGYSDDRGFKPRRDRKRYNKKIDPKMGRFFCCFAPKHTRTKSPLIVTRRELHDSSNPRSKSLIVSILFMTLVRVFLTSYTL